MSSVQPHKRIISGKVVTKAGDKSVTILVERRVIHPKYRKIVKRDKEFARKGLKPIQESPGQERRYQYRRIIPENGLINEMGITEKQYNDPNYKGYKEKYMVSAYRRENGDPRLIRVERRGKFTEEEQKEYDRIMRAKKDLEKMQKAFEGEEK